MAFPKKSGSMSSSYGGFGMGKAKKPKFNPSKASTKSKIKAIGGISSMFKPKAK